MNSQLSKRQRISQIIPFDGNLTPQPVGWERLKSILHEEEEEAVLGSILQNPDLFVLIANQLQGADFYSQLRGFVWFAFDQLNSRKEGIDLLNVANELEKHQQCPLKGEALLNYLGSLYSAPSDSANIEHYARRVREAALKMRMLIALDNARELVYTERDIDSLVDNSNRLLFTATEQYRSEATDAGTIVSELWDNIEGLMRSGVSPTIPTGFPEFDRLTTGATPGELMIIAGSEKMGKTTLLLSWIRNMIKSGKHVLLFTLEMSKAEIMRLLIAMESGIYRDVLKTGQLNEKEFALFIEAAGRVQQWPLDIEDQYSSLTPIQARRQIRFHQAQHLVDIVAIDGLWLMEPDNEDNSSDINKAQNRPRAVHTITRDLIDQAKLFNVPILITHQYVNLSGQGDRKRPSLYDLAESSGVRRNAQLIVGLHRSKKMEMGIEVDQSELWVLADRNGRSQDEHIDLTYDKQYSCYKEA